MTEKIINIQLISILQTLRRKEREHESEMQKLASEKITLQEKIQALKGELQNMNIEVDLNAWMTAHASDNESHSTSTATGWLIYTLIKS